VTQDPGVLANGSGRWVYDQNGKGGSPGLLECLTKGGKGRKKKRTFLGKRSKSTFGWNQKYTLAIRRLFGGHPKPGEKTRKDNKIGVVNEKENYQQRELGKSKGTSQRQGKMEG